MKFMRGSKKPTMTNVCYWKFLSAPNCNNLISIGRLLSECKVGQIVNEMVKSPCICQLRSNPLWLRCVSGPGHNSKLWCRVSALIGEVHLVVTINGNVANFTTDLTGRSLVWVSSWPRLIGIQALIWIEATILIITQALILIWIVTTTSAEISYIPPRPLCGPLPLPSKKPSDWELTAIAKVFDSKILIQISSLWLFLLYLSKVFNSLMEWMSLLVLRAELKASNSEDRPSQVLYEAIPHHLNTNCT